MRVSRHCQCQMVTYQYCCTRQHSTIDCSVFMFLSISQSRVRRCGSIFSYQSETMSTWCLFSRQKSRSLYVEVLGKHLCYSGRESSCAWHARSQTTASTPLAPCCGCGCDVPHQGCSSSSSNIRRCQWFSSQHQRSSSSLVEHHDPSAAAAITTTATMRYHSPRTKTTPLQYRHNHCSYTSSTPATAVT